MLLNYLYTSFLEEGAFAKICDTSQKNSGLWAILELLLLLVVRVGRSSFFLQHFLLENLSGRLPFETFPWRVVETVTDHFHIRI